MVKALDKAPVVRQPLYEKVKGIIRERIRRGDHKPGEYAPTEAELIAEFRISSTTARRCLNDLEHEGLVTRIQGKGTFVRQRDALKAVRHIGIFYHDLVSLTTTFATNELKGIFGQIGRSGFQPDLLSAALVRRSANPSSTLGEMIRQQDIEGLLIVSPSPVGWFEEALSLRIPIVSANVEYDDPRIFSVINDLQSEMETLLSDIIARGHRRMVAIKEVIPENLKGVVSSRIPDLNREGLRCEFETFPYGNPAQARMVVEKHLASNNPPTVFLVYGYELALEVRHSLRSLGREVPHDVSVVAVASPPGPSAFHQVVMPAAEVGAEGTRMLFTLLAGHVPPERVVRVPTEIWTGETLGSVSGKMVQEANI